MPFKFKFHILNCRPDHKICHMTSCCKGNSQRTYTLQIIYQHAIVIFSCYHSCKHIIFSIKRRKTLDRSLFALMPEIYIFLSILEHCFLLRFYLVDQDICHTFSTGGHAGVIHFIPKIHLHIETGARHPKIDIFTLFQGAF